MKCIVRAGGPLFLNCLESVCNQMYSLLLKKKIDFDGTCFGVLRTNISGKFDFFDLVLAYLGQLLVSMCSILFHCI